MLGYSWIKKITAKGDRVMSLLMTLSGQHHMLRYFGCHRLDYCLMGSPVSAAKAHLFQWILCIFTRAIDYEALWELCKLYWLMRPEYVCSQMDACAPKCGPLRLNNVTCLMHYKQHGKFL